ncbi:hypothetical protein A3770_10p59650 [Chloropicon primus]|uniref:Uncharacterized protein n=1 Tax=Chloropicon primus TaxID=1764295 RepID=A0A5B8MT16_9CHLO|nr:hypothetical protein A3770_10p59650 [Chloropicon primus]|eukprot:QDZ23447.1 hypothetical protein A3770_10p59650 [Chloropicon primus]
MVLIPRDPKNRAGRKNGGAHQRQHQQRVQNSRGGGGRRRGGARQGQESGNPKEEERQRKYLEQLNQQAEIAMRVLEREKAELAVMKEKVVGSRSSEGKRKVFDKSQIPGLSPMKGDERSHHQHPLRVQSPPRFDNIEVPQYKNDLKNNFIKAEEEAMKKEFSAEAHNLRSPGYDSPLHSPLPAGYHTPQQVRHPVPAARRDQGGEGPSMNHDDPGGTRRNLFEPDREIRDKDLPASVQKRLEILSTMRENKRRQMSHNSFWGVDNNDPRVVSPEKLHQKNADMYQKGGFLSAMRDLQGGPSEEQRRIAELQRQKLLQDLDEQVRLKREEKRSANMKRKLQEEQAERRARMQALHSRNKAQQQDSTANDERDRYQRAQQPRAQNQPRYMPPIQEGGARPGVPEQPAPPSVHHEGIPQAPPRVQNSPPPPLQISERKAETYNSPVLRARRPFEIENNLNENAQNLQQQQQQQHFNNPAVAPSSRSPGLTKLHQRAAEAGAPENDAISALLSEIRHEQKMLRQQFQEQMQVVSKLEQGARAASKDHEIAMQELKKVKENIHSDSLDEFSVASHYVPKDIGQIPDDSVLSEVEIRLATAGKPRESFEDALGGFLITRESVYLNQDQDEEPTLSPMRNPYAMDQEHVGSVVNFPVDKEVVLMQQEEDIRGKQRNQGKAKAQRKKRPTKRQQTNNQTPPAGRWRL